jgi:hypothetical protein
VPPFYRGHEAQQVTAASGGDFNRKGRKERKGKRDLGKTKKNLLCVLGALCGCCAAGILARRGCCRLRVASRGG